MTLGNLLSAVVNRNLRKTAIVFEDQSISYEQLERSTTSLARSLLEQGCNAGDRIAVHWPNSIETVKLFFACFKAGMIAVPVNVRMKAPEITYVLQQSQAVMYFAHPDLASVAEEVRKGGTGLPTHNTLEVLHSNNNNDDSELQLPESTACRDLPRPKQYHALRCGRARYWCRMMPCSLLKPSMSRNRRSGSSHNDV